MRGADAVRIDAPARRRARLGDIPSFAIVGLSTVFVAGLFASALAPHDPLEVALDRRLLPPVMFGGDAHYLLGTDGLGRDILSRMIVGARLSLILAGVSVTLGAAVGTAIGILSGYVGGRVDAVLMRVADIALGYPIFLLALVLAAAVGPSSENIVVAVVFLLWARFARVVRGEVLSVRERDYVALAQTAGCSNWHIMWRHVWPNVMNTVIVLASLQVGLVILTEASLSFLGAGVPPPAPTWGSMVAEGRDFVATAWWVPTMPSLAILVTVMSFNLLGDWLRDRFDPRRLQF